MCGFSKNQTGKLNEDRMGTTSLKIFKEGTNQYHFTWAVILLFIYNLSLGFGGGEFERLPLGLPLL